MKLTLKQIHHELLNTYDLEGGINHVDETNLPSRAEVEEIIQRVTQLMFPGFFNPEKLTKENLPHWSGYQVDLLSQRLFSIILKSICFTREQDTHKQHLDAAEQITLEVLAELPKVRRLIKKDVVAAYMGDPAAASQEEVIMSYPSIQAVALYRFAHEIYLRGVPFIPRMITEWAKSSTGIDINPGAKIGESFFIDHGTGVVIGETCVIGNNVKIYQMVTLGALSFRKNEQGMLIKGLKRHPTIEDNVILYAGCTILGGDTVIGADSIIGGNVWLTESVAPGTVLTFDVSKQEYRQFNKADKTDIELQKGFGI